MREIVHLTPSDARLVPWKNGRGMTEELALWPHEASFERGDFAWRISRAAVESDGPFSAFPGFERVLVVIAGEGLVLDHGELAPRARVRRLEPYRFAGEWSTRATLVDGPVSDFNVLARRDRCRAEVQALKLGLRRMRESLLAGHTFVHVLTGDSIARVTGEDEPFELGPAESLWLREPRAGDEVELTGGSSDCELLLVQIESASSASRV